MHKGSGLLWALERRGAIQLARFLLQASLPDAARRSAGRTSRTPLPAAAPRQSRRRPRTTPLRLVLS